MSDLRTALRLAQIDHQQEEIDRIIREVEYHGQNKINYSEFLAATVSIKKIITNERLVAVFKQFDTEGNGYITPQNIESAMTKLGQKVSKKDLKDIMQKHDHSGSGSISFDSFRKIFEEAQ